MLHSNNRIQDIQAIHLVTAVLLTGLQTDFGKHPCVSKYPHNNVSNPREDEESHRKI